jgi:hypothetical protein
MDKNAITFLKCYSKYMEMIQRTENRFLYGLSDFKGRCYKGKLEELIKMYIKNNK